MKCSEGISTCGEEMEDVMDMWSLGSVHYQK